jgi:hypothetical protein
MFLQSPRRRTSPFRVSDYEKLALVGVLGDVTLKEQLQAQIYDLVRWLVLPA